MFTRKVGVAKTSVSFQILCSYIEGDPQKSFCHIWPSSLFRYPIVVSENLSVATSVAMLAPLNAEHETPSRFWMSSAKMWISDPLTSTPCRLGLISVGRIDFAESVNLDERNCSSTFCNPSLQLIQHLGQDCPSILVRPSLQAHGGSPD